MRRRIEAGFDALLSRVERRVEAGRRDTVTSDVRARVDVLWRVARAAQAREALIDALEGPDAVLASESDALEAEVEALAELA